uniref:Uncharacterized protein n=1 Tax=Vespula pensylvanica TaxID=30213 RepID=A0A834KNX6_VESPE|nr:hypothetical protein H0235_014244 [Vespula pensylvanica]
MKPDLSNIIIIVFNHVALVEYVLFRTFRTDNFNLEDEEHSSYPSTTNTELIMTMVVEQSRYTIRELADTLNNA